VPAFSAFLLCVLIFRYVSLGSVVAALVLLLTVMGFLGAWARPAMNEPQWPILAWALLVGLVIRKHAANINRLMQGTESKLWGSSKNA
jgi:glycerol-3-phosphate acyltransferase PlsY